MMVEELLVREAFLLTTLDFSPCQRVDLGVTERVGTTGHPLRTFPIRE
jgi:hypothetical protein